jgi:hypothetical protein
VTLSEVIPARKLYADMLFAVSQYAKSLKQYQVVMKSSPNQPNALLAAAMSAEKTGKDKLPRCR